MLGHNPDLMGPLVILLIATLVTLIIFLIARELVCWYWKINKVVDLLERIANNLESSQKTK